MGVGVEIDPEQIGTAAQLVEHLGELYTRGGWSIHRMAQASGLSTATVQAIVNGTTRLPQTSTVKAFVTACGQDPAPWVAARGRAANAARTFHTGLRVVNIPRVETTFVGRTAELAQLSQASRTPVRATGAGRPRGVVVQAVHGLGGVGKSTLVAYWARTRLREVAVTWWITADSADGVTAGLAELAVAVKPELTGQPLEDLAVHARAWLAATPGWLLVLDNVTAPADVAPLLDRDPPGQIVMTSRLAEGWHRLGAAVIALNVLPQQQAIELLTALATDDHTITGAGADTEAEPVSPDDVVELADKENRERQWPVCADCGRTTSAPQETLRDGRAVTLCRTCMRAVGARPTQRCYWCEQPLGEGEAREFSMEDGRATACPGCLRKYQLVTELGCLPLAIEQAGAFLRQARLQVTDYLQLLRDNPAVMYDQTAHGSASERTIARIWRITLDHLATTTPGATSLLRVLAWWAPKNIPRTLLAQSKDMSQTVTALGGLNAYNMITLDNKNIAVHPLGRV
jgi:hypothetical protein